MIDKETIEVGDKIKISNAFTTYIVEIERITPAKAVSKPYNDSGSRQEFKRNCLGGIRPYRKVEWDTRNFKFV